VTKACTRTVTLARKLILRHGISLIQAVVIEAPSWEFVAPRQGLLDHDTAMSERPPLLTDFWDPSVSADGFQPRVRSHWRVNADPFSLPS
jgi:hypothetical protein